MPVKIFSLLTVGRFRAAPESPPAPAQAFCLQAVRPPWPPLSLRLPGVGGWGVWGGGGATSSQVPLGLQCPSAPRMLPRAPPAEVAVVLGVVSVNFWSHRMVPSLLSLRSFFSFLFF